MIASSDRFPMRYMHGFTLLELLIAVSMSAILMLVLVAGLNTISRDWEKHGKQLDQAIDESLLLLQLEKAILGTFNYRFKENNIAKEQLFFEGNKTELKWVSTVSPERNNSLTLWHIQIRADGGMFLTTLPAYPGSLNNQLEKYQSHIEKRHVYFEDYKIAMFFLSESTNKKKQWVTDWAAEEKDKLPLGVRLEFTLAQQSEQTDLPSDWTLFSFIRVSDRTTLGRSTGTNTARPNQSLPIDSDRAPGNTDNRPGLFK